MRSMDWSTTPLGPVEAWTSSLRTTVSTCLNSRFPIVVWWGPDLTTIYNDGYSVMLGGKHPWSMGKRGNEVWPEIWAVIGPMLDSVLRAGSPTWSENQHLPLERHGFAEECYFTFSYSPVRDESGVAGIFCAVTETTKQMLGERRLRTLRDLAARSVTGSETVAEACRTSAITLAANPHDFPFALIYLADADGKSARIMGSANIMEGAAASPLSVAFGGQDDVWDLGGVAETRQSRIVEDLEAKFDRLPAGPWLDDATRRALVLPLTQSGAQEVPAGFLVAGLSPRLALSDEYRSFLELAAGQLASAINRVRAYEEERRRAEALAELDRAKTAFFSNVSHEFRTPLTLMLGPLEDTLAEAELLPAAARDRLEAAHRNSLRLLKLVNAMLDFSRIEAGRIRANYEPVDLAELTAELASVFRSAIERAGLRLIVNCPPLPEPIYVDRDMWEKIVLNLVSNAFKFTLQGEIEVRVESVDGAARLTVRDTGVGIPAEELPRTFERFHRVENSRGRTHEGTGIGLALVQELVKLHGGTVSAESKVDEGCRFFVTIPRGKTHLDPSHMQHASELASTKTGASAFVEEALRWLPDRTGDAARASPAPAGASAGNRLSRPAQDRRPRILWADDNADMREYVSRLLKEQFEVETASDGETALISARANPPDLILTDIMMPRLDGFGLMRKLRADPALREVPIIMLSARAGEEARIEGMAAGADDYVIKPFSARELLARIESRIEIARFRRQARQALRESEERFGRFMQHLPGLAWIKDSAGRYVFANDAAEKAFRTPRERLYGKADFEIFPHEVAAQFRGHDRQALETEGLQVIETLEHEDGVPHHSIVSKFPIPGPAGQSSMVGGMAIDITDRIRAEEERERREQELRRRTAQYRTLLNQAPIGVYLVDADFRIDEVNPSAQPAFGDIPDLIGRDFDDVMHILWPEEHANEMVRKFRHTLETGESYHAPEHVGRRLDRDATEYYEWRIDRIPLPDGRRGVVCYFREISQQVLARVAITESEERFRTLADNIAQFAWMADSNGSRFWFNRRWYEYTGTTLEEMQGWGWTRVHHPDHVDRVVETTRHSWEAGEDWEETFPLRGKDGTHRWFLSRAVPIRDEEGRIVRWFGTNTDVTEQRAAQEALKEADRRKDEFLATLAHELRNPLAPIRLGLELMRVAENTPSRLEEIRGMMERQTQQLIMLVDDLLDVSRITRGKLELRKSRISLAAAVQNAIEAAHPFIDAAGHELIVELPPRQYSWKPTRIGSRRSWRIY